MDIEDLPETKTVENARYAIWTPPPILGYWCFGDPSDPAPQMRIAEHRKVSWFHKKMMRLLLGIYYRKEI